jgi:hypothetical protein
MGRRLGNVRKVEDAPSCGGPIDRESSLLRKMWNGASAWTTILFELRHAPIKYELTRRLR